MTREEYEECHARCEKESMEYVEKNLGWCTEGLILKSGVRLQGRGVSEHSLFKEKALKNRGLLEFWLDDVWNTVFVKLSEIDAVEIVRHANTRSEKKE